MQEICRQQEALKCTNPKLSSSAQKLLSSQNCFCCCCCCCVEVRVLDGCFRLSTSVVVCCCGGKNVLWILSLRVVCCCGRVYFGFDQKSVLDFELENLFCNFVVSLEAWFYFPFFVGRGKSFEAMTTYYFVSLFVCSCKFEYLMGFLFKH